MHSRQHDWWVALHDPLVIYKEINACESEKPISSVAAKLCAYQSCGAIARSSVSSRGIWLTVTLTSVSPCVVSLIMYKAEDTVQCSLKTVLCWSVSAWRPLNGQCLFPVHRTGLVPPLNMTTSGLRAHDRGNECDLWFSIFCSGKSWSWLAEG